MCDLHSYIIIIFYINEHFRFNQTVLLVFSHCIIFKLNRNDISLPDVIEIERIPSLSSGPTSKSVTSHGFTVEWGTCENGDNSMYRVLYRKRGVSVWTVRNVTQKVAVFNDLPHNTHYHVRIMCYWRDKSSDSLRLIANLFNQINVRTLCTGRYSIDMCSFSYRLVLKLIPKKRSVNRCICTFSYFDINIIAIIFI